MSRPPFKPTDEHRRMVRKLAGLGVPHTDIGHIIGTCEKTVRKAFRKELDEGAASANAKVAASLFQRATDPKGGREAVTAAIFWAKARMRWTEREVVELTGKDGGPVQTEAVVQFFLPHNGRDDEDTPATRAAE